MSIKPTRQQGFTIVELLIVIIVIAILAALVITAYSGVQQRARDAERQSDTRAIANAIAIYNVDNTPLSCSVAIAPLGATAGNDTAVNALAGALKVDASAFKAPGKASNTGGSMVNTASANKDQYGCQDGTNTITLSWTEEINGLKTRTVSW